MTKKWSEVKAAKGRPTFTALAERDGKFWFMRVVGRPELFTQSVRLDQAEDMVRDLIATYDERAPGSFDVRIRIRIDDEVDEATEALLHLRLIEAMGASLTRALAVTLVRSKGFSMRDAAKVIGLSHQRVAQLLDEHDELGGDARPSLAAQLAQLDQWSNRKATITIGPGDSPGKIARARVLVGARSKPGQVHRIGEGPRAAAASVRKVTRH